jgi:hypothetical protein
LLKGGLISEIISMIGALSIWAADLLMGPAYSVSIRGELSIMAMFESAAAASGTVGGGRGSADGAVGLASIVGRGSAAAGATSGRKTVFFSALEGLGVLPTFSPGNIASCLQAGHRQT